jgi:transcription antitermination factor NusG
MNKQWHILYTNPRAEKRVLSYLQKYNFESYLPLLNIKTKWSDRWKMVEKPMFTSYVFVKISYWDDKNKILILPGIHHIVFYKGIPAVLEDEIIEMMKILVVNFGEKIQVIKDENLQPGRILEIKYGNFKGHKAEVVEIKNKTYVVMNLPMMGQQARTEIKIEDLGLEEGWNK